MIMRGSLTGNCQRSFSVKTQMLREAPSPNLDSITSYVVSKNERRKDVSRRGIISNVESFYIDIGVESLRDTCVVSFLVCLVCFFCVLLKIKSSQG
jgi:hypothetical protein